MRLRAGRLDQVRRRPNGHPSHRHRTKGGCGRNDSRSWCLRLRRPLRHFACLRSKVEFSVVMVKSTAVRRAIESITDDASAPVKYPCAVRGPETDAWISDAGVAETAYTAFASMKTSVTAGLIVHRAKTHDSRTHCSPSVGITAFINAALPTATADVTHCRRAIIEIVSPTSSTNHLRTCRRGVRGELLLGVLRGDRPQSASGNRRSCRRPACAFPMGRRFGARSSISLALEAISPIFARLCRPQGNLFCDYRPTRRGPMCGFDCGATHRAQPVIHCYWTGVRGDEVREWRY
ncbi:hypothetical protein ABH922_005621 [Rhodococcus sp. 27YEA15]